MLWDALFWIGLTVAVVIGFLYFRELGDISQMIFKIKRENLVRAIRNEYKLVALGLLGAAAMAFAHLAMGGGIAWVFWIAAVVVAFLYGFTYVWLHIGMRHHRSNAKYYSIKEARQFVSPSNSVVVIENEGIARAHPDGHILRPHLAGNPEGFGGENVVMTYCGMANLGIAYKPEIGGKAVEMEVMAQLGNNLILRDNATGEPIQQIYGAHERDENRSSAMTPWPTFRMTFRGFEKAYPDGQVYLNIGRSNPLVGILDVAQDMMFTWGITAQHRVAAPVTDNMTRLDDRLPNKTYVWGVNVGDDAACYTDDFVIEHGRPINATVGRRDIVVAWHQPFESLGIWYNDTGSPVSEIDIYGKSDRGQHARVETLKPGMFWHVWAEFFPHTDINRTDELANEAA